MVMRLREPPTAVECQPETGRCTNKGSILLGFVGWSPVALNERCLARASASPNIMLVQEPSATASGVAVYSLYTATVPCRTYLRVLLAPYPAVRTSVYSGLWSVPCRTYLRVLRLCPVPAVRTSVYSVPVHLLYVNPCTTGAGTDRPATGRPCTNDGVHLHLSYDFGAVSTIPCSYRSVHRPTAPCTDHYRQTVACRTPVVQSSIPVHY